MKKQIFVLFAIYVLALPSCCKLPDVKDNERLYYELETVLYSYIRTCFELPENADDLIRFIELDGGLLSDGLADESLAFLKKNHKKIIIVQLPIRGLLNPQELDAWKREAGEDGLDELYTAMFFRNKKLKNLITSYSSNMPYCGDVRRGMQYVRFFDQNKNPIFKDSAERYNIELQRKLFSPEVRYKYPDNKWLKKPGSYFESYFEEFIIVEYTRENGLRNLCNNTKVEVTGSEYFEAFDSCLRHFMEDHPELSRMVLDTYIPEE
jgi:hypothetical protein